VTKLVSLAKVTDVGIADPASEMLRGGVVSIGNFDGVHRGHLNLLAEVRRQADRLGGPAIAVVLDPHPAAILRPDRVPPKLTWLERRAELLERVGIDFLAVCQTSAEFLDLSAESFFRSLVVDRLQAKGMVEGPNFFFGKNRAGDIETLTQLCQQADIELSIVEPTMVDGRMISSTRIRELLRQGAVEVAADLLGAPYRIRGRVVPGDRRGRAIGFPTANLEQLDVVVPKAGVYGGFAQLVGNGARTKHLAAIHIGPNPTFDDDLGWKTEIHLLDFSGDLYGESLLVDFVTAVRDIARFDSAEQLAAQLSLDVNTIRERLGSEQLDQASNHPASGKGK
jgi:riboflavin kinase/FMN adenylyltransferase